MKKNLLVVIATMSALVLVFANTAFADVGRTVPGTYATAAIGSANLGGLCLGGDLNSCVEADPIAGETHVSVTINDDAGFPVFGTVGQDLNGDGLTDWSASFCGSTTVDLPIEDEVLGAPVPVIVFPWLLPGVDETTLEPCVGVGTSGTVDITFHVH